MSRHHVHLSETGDTAVSVGQRRGRPLVLEIRAGEMHRAGSRFYRTPNGVWLTAEVPPAFLERPPVEGCSHPESFALQHDAVD